MEHQIEPSKIIDRWIDVGAEGRPELLLEDYAVDFDIELAQQLKAQVDHLMRSDLSRATDAANLMAYMSKHCEDPKIKVEALLAMGNVQCIGQGDLETAIETYDRAAAICEASQLPVDRARAQIGKVAALAHLGRSNEAFEVGLPALEVLEKAGNLELIIRMISNLGIAYSHAGNDAGSLEMFDRGQQAYLREPGGEETTWYLLQMNRSFALRGLGRFEESLAAGKDAIQGFEQLSKTAEAARAREHLALTYYVMGHYNEALRYLDLARDSFSADDRVSDAALVDLFVSDILLELRRFDGVLELCREAQEVFLRVGDRQNAAQALSNQAAAYSRLGRYDEALKSLSEAQAQFDALGNQTWRRSSQLKSVSILIQAGRAKQGLDLAAQLWEQFRADGLDLEAVESSILAAKAGIAIGDDRTAKEWIARAVDDERDMSLPGISYRLHQLLAALFESEGNREKALEELDHSLMEFERLRSRIMVEHRIRFQEDKDAIYVDAVRLAMDLGLDAQAFEYAERAKSRALVDLVANRVNLSLEPRDIRDQDLLNEIQSLTKKRDQQNRHREVAMSEERGSMFSGAVLADQTVELEDRIAEAWHRLLVRNADYASEAAIWTVRTEPVTPYLDPETVLLEYFLLESELVVWAVSPSGIASRRFSLDYSKTSNLIQLLRHNLSLVPSAEVGELPDLGRNARGLLEDLASLIFAPVHDLVSGASSLLIVPHGILHYVPFHALRLNDCYLVELQGVSYLPAASVLRYCREAEPAPDGALVVGCSSAGALPHAVLEADAVAGVLGGQVLLEGKAHRDEVATRAAHQRIVHIAAHGEFRGDSPLFSGLLLSDGWLTVLDIFGMRLHASLVTLSACQTGESLVAGGDELLGLMRAFLSAGAAAILSSLWAVSDQSTARFMERFYRELTTGHTKAESLRRTQLAFLENALDGVNDDFSHPYYWAPYVIFGDERTI